MGGIISYFCKTISNYFKIEQHNAVLDRRQREIAQCNASLLQFREISDEVKTKQLADKVNKCLVIKEIILPIEVPCRRLPELTDEQEAAAMRALSKQESPHAVLAKKFSINITRRDMLTLDGLNWLNDEIINFYMNLIIERGKLSNFPNVYAFNTFFYPKYLKDGHRSISRWTKKVDIFKHDLLIVPIHLGLHWCMAIIDFRSNCVAYYDSMGKSNHVCTQALLRYIQEEHADKKRSQLDVSSWDMKCYKDIPQQMNGSDCGVFSCTFAEFASRNDPFNFSQEDMPYIRQKMVVEILRGELLIT